nr:MAG TPA: hypothetical protein [Caudoviricetes sp.]
MSDFFYIQCNKVVRFANYSWRQMGYFSARAVT